MEINLLNTLFVDTIDSSYIQNTVYESDNTDIEENNKLQTEYINKSKILSIPKKINNSNFDRGAFLEKLTNGILSVILLAILLI